MKNTIKNISILAIFTTFSFFNNSQAMTQELDIKISSVRKTMVEIDTWHGAKESKNLILHNDLLIWGNQKDMEIIDRKTGKFIKTLSSHKGPIIHLEGITENIIASTSYDNTVRIWDITKPDGEECIYVHEIKGAALLRCLLKITNSLLLVGLSSGNIILLDITKKNEETIVMKPFECASKISCLAKTSENNVAIGDIGCQTINFLNLETKQGFKTPKNFGNARCLMPLSSTKLVAAVEDNSDEYIKIWDLKNDNPPQILKGHKERISCLTPISSHLIASGSWDKTIKIWKLENNKCIKIIDCKNPVVCLSYFQKESNLVAVTDCGDIITYHLNTKPN